MSQHHELSPCAPPCAASWLEPLLQSVGDVFSTIDTEDLQSADLDKTEFVQVYWQPQ